ncbi:BREX-2 system ATPase PglY [Kitasatospora fiedleri]|uniref:BREX-2 system ATPase PglY n=1 Tax=Kitasatospora fiedleri TaxID=2991545 RepID=UPI00249AC8E2|nr:phage resistance protein [Kitasatospora fiedleri]
MAFMKKGKPHAEDRPLLRELIDIKTTVSTSDYVLRLSEAVTPEGAVAALRDYVVTDRLKKNFDDALGYIKAALDGHSSKAVYLHGSFGSGKSHFMAVLYALLSGHQAVRSREEFDAVRAKHAWLDEDGRKFLLVPYHMLSAKSLEQRVLGRYVDHVHKLHPAAPLPQVYRTDGLFEDFAQQRRFNGDAKVIEQLSQAAAPDSSPAATPSGGAGAADNDGWGDLVPAGDSSFRWTSELLDTAVSAPEEHENTKQLDLKTPTTPQELRARLVQDLSQTLFPAFARNSSEDAEAFVSLDRGLGIIAEHAKSLGYDGLILFMDELILWLAGLISDQKAMSREADKITNLVEGADERRAIPIVSFIARQRDLRELVGEELSGAAEVAVQEGLKLSIGRFDKITLEDRNLPQIAQARLLKPLTPQAEAQIDTAFDEAKRLSPDVWQTLLGDDKSTTGADEESFRRTYPFSPAFMDTLVHISGALQRSRTGLKLMGQLLSDHRDDWRLGQLVPLGDLYPALVGGGDQAFTGEEEVHFKAADKLYQEKLRPFLLRAHNLDEDTVATYRRDPKSLTDPQLASRCRDFTGDARLMHTLLLSALAPTVPALADLTLKRLHALNYGSIITMIPGTEVSRLFTKVNEWAAAIPEIKRTGTDASPAVRLELTGIDLEAVLANARVHNNQGARKARMQALLKEALAITRGPDGLGGYDLLNLVWKGTQRHVEVVFGNVADVDSLNELDLAPAGDDVWRLVVDLPYDEGEFTPVDDVQRLRKIREKTGGTVRTLAWLPSHLTRAARDDFELLVVIDKLLADDDRFDNEYARRLKPDDKISAKGMFASQRERLTEELGKALRQAYGLEQKKEGKVALDFDQHLVPLRSDLPEDRLKLPIGATLHGAARELASKLLAVQFPAHPDLDPDNRGHAVTPTELRTVFGYVRQAAESPDGRAEVAAKDRQVMARIAGGLQLGTQQEAYYKQSSYWPDHFQRLARQDGVAEPTLVRLGDWMNEPAPRGLPEAMQKLVASAYAEMTDRVWVLGGSLIDPAPATPADLRLTYGLREQPLPDEADWVEAQARFQAVFGAKPPQLRRGRIVNQFAGQIRQQARGFVDDADRLVAALERNRSQLGLDDASPRLDLARRATALVRTLAGDPTVAGTAAASGGAKGVVETLARFDLGGFTAQRFGTSLKTAGKVTDALHRAGWEELKLADGYGVEGLTIVTRLQEAASGDPVEFPDFPALLSTVGGKVIALVQRERAARQRAEQQAERPEPVVFAKPDDIDLNGGSAHPPISTGEATAGEAVGGEAVGSRRTPGARHSGGGRTTAARAVASLRAEIAELAELNPDATVEISWKVVD